MKSRLSWLFNLVLVLAIALSGLVVQAPAVAGTGGTNAVPAVSTPPLAASKSKPGHHHKGKHDRGRERTHKDKHKQKHRNQPDTPTPSTWPDKGPTVGDPAGKDGDDPADDGSVGELLDNCSGPSIE